MEFKLAHNKALPWNIPVPIFEGLYSRGLLTIEREIEMLKGYIQP